MNYLSELIDTKHTPAVIRLVMGITSWMWMLLNGAWPIMVASLVSLAFFNVPGDKRPEEEPVIGIAIPGKLRVILEVITATLGLLFSAFSLPTAIIQLIITILYLRYDTERLSWLWGWRTYPPEYITDLYKLKAKKEKT